ncbi:ABC transporter permease [Actinophytocola oryzae]|uniref:ABC-2 type transport system permease protein n=1 Tax=Actinophytocola oryzae TaxID=502181 RepID=A0A4R7V4K4_9PSEU|nr:ABC transporter permease [Actinophytocola oryzae]TDV43612.1 hypothetical protein CLV71_11574 [Actinophytocola oryzae]
MSAFAGVLRAEWTKVATVRSTWWSLFTTTVLCVGLGVLLGFQVGGGSSDGRGDLEALIAFFPLVIGQIALVAFGVLVAGAEYSSGTVRASLVAVPARGVFLAAKTLVTAGVAGVVSVVVAFGTFFATQWGLGEHGVSLSDPGMTRAVLGACVYLTAMCVFAMGVATVLRSSALSLGILLPLLFLNSQGLSSVPAIRSVTQYLPDQAGAGLMRVGGTRWFMGELTFGVLGSLLVLLGWVAAALAGGYLSLRRRDA